MASGDTVYTHGHHAAVLRSHRWRTAANSAAYLLPHLRPGDAVLDVGCGPGTITADLAVLVAPGRVTALDRAETVLDQARATIREHGPGERGLDTVDFATGDVHALDFPDDSFDVVHAHQVLQHVGDPVRALSEMRRVCRPLGIVAARDSDYAAFTWYPSMPELDDWLALYREVARRNGGEPDAGRRLRSWAQQAGFTDVTAGASVWCFANDEGLAWWAGMWADRIVSSAIADQAVAYGLATRNDLERMAAAWRRMATAPDGWFLVPHAEILARV
jgi:ubiquinone/menaquinone biosynthesis C-methylase UbiE